MEYSFIALNSSIYKRNLLISDMEMPCSLGTGSKCIFVNWSTHIAYLDVPSAFSESLVWFIIVSS